jgi:hypothetical protein
MKNPAVGYERLGDVKRRGGRALETEEHFDRTMSSRRPQGRLERDRL